MTSIDVVLAGLVGKLLGIAAPAMVTSFLVCMYADMSTRTAVIIGVVLTLGWFYFLVGIPNVVQMAVVLPPTIAASWLGNAIGRFARGRRS